MGETAISWTHIPSPHGGQYKGWTWNPTTGCTRVSSGCNLCYAFTLHDQRHLVNRLAGAEYLLAEGHEDAGRMAAIRARALGASLPMSPQYDRPFSQVQLLPDRLVEPLHWQRPRGVFVDSMSDLFHPDVPDEYLDQVFGVMMLAPTHIFMILTKRPERMRDYLGSSLIGYPVELVVRWLEAASELAGPGATLPPAQMIAGGALANVWLGASVENQETADERLPLLAETPASIRFVSAEPLIDRINLGKHMWGPLATDQNRIERPHPDWVIVGGESGDSKHRREMDPDWAREIRDHCYAASVPFFFKQSSGARPGKGTELDGETYHEFPRHPMVGSVDTPLVKRYR